MTLLTEALSIGFVVGLIGTPVSYIAMRLTRKRVDLSTKTWFRIFLTYVVVGILTHLIFEYTGLNKKYCKEGHACKK